MKAFVGCWSAKNFAMWLWCPQATRWVRERYQWIALDCRTSGETWGSLEVYVPGLGVFNPRDLQGKITWSFRLCYTVFSSLVTGLWLLTGLPDHPKSAGRWNSIQVALHFQHTELCEAEIIPWNNLIIIPCIYCNPFLNYFFLILFVSAAKRFQ